MSDGKSSIDEAFVLAAGLGTRMRPITEKIPKPLVNVWGKTLLDHALDALGEAGVCKAVVNVHYLADQIEDHVASRTQPGIVISDEREKLLDSGGGVKHGIGYFAGDALYILNADSFWIEGARQNLLAMQEAWQADAMDMMLLLAPMTNAVGFDGRGDFFMDSEGRLTRRGEAETAPFVYAGAIITKPELFSSENDDKFSLNRLFDQALERGRLYGVRLDGLWLHVGTPDAIAEAEAAIAGKTAR